MDYYTADIHLWHKNVIAYEKRPFANVNTMHQKIKSNWNKTVGPDDDVWVGGDVAFNKHMDPLGEFIRSLNGNKHLVLGNHDDIFKNFTWHKIGFQTVHTVCKLNTTEDIWMAHHPDARTRYGLPQYHTLFHGHIHGREGWRVKFGPDQGWNVNVGMDLHDFTPITMEQIITEMNKELKRRNDGVL